MSYLDQVAGDFQTEAVDIRYVRGWEAEGHIHSQDNLWRETEQVETADGVSESEEAEAGLVGQTKWSQQIRKRRMSEDHVLEYKLKQREEVTRGGAKRGVSTEWPREPLTGLQQRTENDR